MFRKQHMRTKMREQQAEEITQQPSSTTGWGEKGPTKSRSRRDLTTVHFGQTVVSALLVTLQSRRAQTFDSSSALPKRTVNVFESAAIVCTNSDTNKAVKTPKGIPLETRLRRLVSIPCSEDSANGTGQPFRSLRLGPGRSCCERKGTTPAVAEGAWGMLSSESLPRRFWLACASGPPARDALSCRSTPARSPQTLYMAEPAGTEESPKSETTRQRSTKR